MLVKKLPLFGLAGYAVCTAITTFLSFLSTLIYSGNSYYRYNDETNILTLLISLSAIGALLCFIAATVGYFMKWMQDRNTIKLGFFGASAAGTFSLAATAIISAITSFLLTRFYSSYGYFYSSYEYPRFWVDLSQSFVYTALNTLFPISIAALLALMAMRLREKNNMLFFVFLGAAGLKGLLAIISFFTALSGNHVNPTGIMSLFSMGLNILFPFMLAFGEFSAPEDSN